MADEVLEGVPPTRMEYLKLKNKLRRAEKGHKLLKEKRDNLLMEFMNIARHSFEISEDTLEQIQKANQAQAEATAAVGTYQIESAADAGSRMLEADIDYKNVMGIKIPTIRVEGVERAYGTRGTDSITTHPTIFESAHQHEKTIKDLVILSETEYSLRQLSEETKKTKRRVNALEYRLIPRIRNTRKYIRMRLDELERGDFSTRKMLKKKSKR